MFDALCDYRAHRYQVAHNRIEADRLRDRLLMLVYFKAIHRFSKFKDRKLANIRTVNQYLQEKRTKAVINMLRNNMTMVRTKEQKLRQACHFHLFRKPVILK